MDINKIAFDLGWDFAVYGLQILDTNVNPQMHEGFKAAKEKRITKRSDKYILKWLYIRNNALRRSRAVAEHVTPDLLRYLDLGVCPITLKDLTHATGEDTDWSVDRIDNNGAYAAGNLCIMSVKANLAKANLGVEEIKSIYWLMKENSMDFDEKSKLSLYEWNRLAWVAHRGDPMLWPLVCPPLPMVSLSYSESLQFNLLVQSHFKDKKIAVNTKHLLNKLQHKKLTKYYEAVAKVVPDYHRFSVKVFDAYQHLPVFERFLDLYEILSSDQCLQLLEATDSKRVGSRKIAEDFTSTWRLETNGYISAEDIDETKVKQAVEEYCKRATIHVS
jgi:hypothetical protein